MISGIDYVVVSNIPFQEIEPLFVQKIFSHWKNPLIEEFNRSETHLELFFAKNEAMSKKHEKKGFSVDKNGEGCFMFCSRRIEYFEGNIKVQKIVQPVSMASINPYEACFLLHHVWEYTLVLPEVIEESRFSRNIFEDLKKSIK